MKPGIFHMLCSRGSLRSDFGKCSTVLPADEWGRSGSVFSGLPFSPCLFGINLDLELFLVDEVVWDP